MGLISFDAIVGDIGTTFKVTITESGAVLNISGATTKEIKLQKPDGTTLTKTASFFTDGSDGIITYDSIDGDLSIKGLWKIQGSIVLTGTWHTSDIGTFKVGAAL